MSAYSVILDRMVRSELLSEIRLDTIRLAGWVEFVLLVRFGADVCRKLSIRFPVTVPIAGRSYLLDLDAMLCAKSLVSLSITASMSFAYE